MLTTIFCHSDDFCKDFEKQFNRNFLTSGENIRKKSFKLTLSEIVTISIFYHHSGYKTFKDYYEKYVLVHMCNDFKELGKLQQIFRTKKKCASSFNCIYSIERHE